MIENVQIVNKNGDTMQVEAISYIALQNGKNYLFYTLNEKVDNDMTKIYIAESTPNAEEANPIDAETWDDLKRKMTKLSHKEEVPDITFLNITGGPFNVGEAKKLAITSVMKQSFIEVQAAHSIVSDSNEVPATSGSFFDSTPIEQNTKVEETPKEESIFANPPQPIITEQNVVPNVIPTSIEQQQTIAPIVSDANIASSVQPEPVTAIEPDQQIPVAPIPDVQPELTPSISTEIVANEQPINNSPQVGLSSEQMVTPMPETIAPVEIVQTAQPTAIVQEQPIAEQPVQQINEAKTIISDEEALKAIDIIQNYIDQENQES